MTEYFTGTFSLERYLALARKQCFDCSLKYSGIFLPCVYDHLSGGDEASPNATDQTRRHCKQSFEGTPRYAEWLKLPKCEGESNCKNTQKGAAQHTFTTSDYL